MGSSVGRFAYRRPLRRMRSRGQSLVEFALISPIFLALFFGIVEYSLINASIGAFDFAAVAGARVGAIDGTASSAYGDPTSGVDDDILHNGIIPHVTGLVMAQITEVDVFKAGEDGGCYDGSQFPCLTNRDTYTPAGGWAYTDNGDGTSGWPPINRSDQLLDADYLGVRIVYRYTYLTSLLATTSPALFLTAVSVQRIEPQAYQTRVPGPVVMTASYAPLGVSGATTGAGAASTQIWRRRVNSAHTVNRTVDYAL